MPNALVPAANTATSAIAMSKRDWRQTAIVACLRVGQQINFLIGQFKFGHLPITVEVSLSGLIDPQCYIPAFEDVHVVDSIGVAAEVYCIRAVFIGYSECTVNIVRVALWIPLSIVNGNRPECACGHLFQGERLRLSAIGENSRIHSSFRCKPAPAHCSTRIMFF